MARKTSIAGSAVFSIEHSGYHLDPQNRSRLDRIEREKPAAIEQQEIRAR
jgi:hypothetical protein